MSPHGLSFQPFGLSDEDRRFVDAVRDQSAGYVDGEDWHPTSPADCLRLCDLIDRLSIPDPEDWTPEAMAWRLARTPLRPDPAPGHVYCRDPHCPRWPTMRVNHVHRLTEEGR